MLALLVHAAAIVALYEGWHPEYELDIVIAPKIVNATLITMEPKSMPKPAPAPSTPPTPNKPIIQQKPTPAPAPKPAPAPSPVKSEPKPEPKPDPELIRRNAEAEAQRKADALRQQRLQELASQSFEDALANEEVNLDDATEAGEAAKSYRQGIYELVVANWSKPPSARMGMKALLRVELVPTGDLVAVNVIESSGNPAFDRSAEQAVQKAGKFEVPRDNALFESSFRRFNLLFQPEDLFR
jgi:TonB family protein